MASDHGDAGTEEQFLMGNCRSLRQAEGNIFWAFLRLGTEARKHNMVLSILGIQAKNQTSERQREKGEGENQGQGSRQGYGISSEGGNGSADSKTYDEEEKKGSPEVQREEGQREPNACWAQGESHGGHPQRPRKEGKKQREHRRHDQRKMKTDLYLRGGKGDLLVGISKGNSQRKKKNPRSPGYKKPQNEAPAVTQAAQPEKKVHTRASDHGQEGPRMVTHCD